MNSISKKALLSVLMFSATGVVTCAGENFAPAPMSTAVKFVDGSEVMSPEMAHDVNWIRALMPVSVVPAPLTRFERFKAACGNAVASVRATRPAQFVESVVTTHPKKSKAVAGLVGTAVVAGIAYKIANSERGKAVRAKITNSDAYKSVANFVATHQEELKTAAKVVAGVATAVVAAKVGASAFRGLVYANASFCSALAE